MKIDTHCHVKEGSVDSKVPLDAYITRLKELGFDGMLITDHDTYNGYRQWKYNMKGRVHEDFLVLKGIEYDTRDGGHILVIMPENVKMRLLELRGLPVATLIEFVHHHGGVLGPAHPCGGKYLSYTHAKRHYENPELIKRFDFIESFNACEPAESNAVAKKLKEKYRKPGLGGSDAHKLDCVGLGYTILPEKITCESDLIRLIKEKADFKTGGELYGKTTKDKMGRADFFLTYSFWCYNMIGTIMKHRKRKRIGAKEELDHETMGRD